MIVLSPIRTSLDEDNVTSGTQMLKEASSRAKSLPNGFGSDCALITRTKTSLMPSEIVNDIDISFHKSSLVLPISNSSEAIDCKILPSLGLTSSILIFGLTE
ncbi:hypothetical protein D3C87_1374360 [compost metagenome]